MLFRPREDSARAGAGPAPSPANVRGGARRRCAVETRVTRAGPDEARTRRALRALEAAPERCATVQPARHGPQGRQPMAVSPTGVAARDDERALGRLLGGGDQLARRLS